MRKKVQRSRTSTGRIMLPRVLVHRALQDPVDSAAPVVVVVVVVEAALVVVLQARVAAIKATSRQLLIQGRGHADAWPLLSLAGVRYGLA